jgi:gliding motility-associated-like protein
MLNKSFLFILIFAFNSRNLIAQVNFVPNGSFEILTSCPTRESQIDLAYPWKSSTFNGTPDLYNKCATADIISVPVHYWKSYQQPNSGDGYAGIFTYRSGILSETEFLSCDLLTNLKDKKYFVEFYISPQIEDDPFDIPCYTEGLGIVLNDVDSIYSLKKGEGIPLLPQVHNYGTILRDTQNWIRVAGCFNGNGENHLIIGNFKSHEQTSADPICHKSFPNSAYYYVDDVGVYEFDPLPDTIYLCKDEFKKIGKRFLDATYNWNTGDRDSVITIHKEGIYIVNVQIADCVLADTVLVLDPEKVIINLSKEFVICKEEKMKLEIPIDGIYSWSTGENTKEIEVTKYGSYEFHVQNECGVYHSWFDVIDQECNCKYYAPNVFSPNGDNINDFFELVSNCVLTTRILSFEVFNRWGELVFHSLESGHQKLLWDGRYKGKKILPGVYVWSVVYEYSSNTETIKKKQSGDILVVD